MNMAGLAGMLSIAALDWDWAQWATPYGARWWDETLCSVLVGIVCGVLGVFVVLRRMALIGDALSHAVLPGVVVAFMITQSSGVTGLLLGALLAGLLTAVLINLVSRFSRTKEDSAIGIVFTALFAVGVILISALPRGVHFDLKCFLFGDPLAVQRQDLILMAVVCPLVLGVVALLYHRLKIASFDPVVAAAMGIPVMVLHYLLMGMLSTTVVAGLKTTGVILVVAMVITPASAAYQLTDRFARMLVYSALIGGLAAAAGMSLAFVANAPTGPAMVLVAALLFALAVIASPSHGYIAQRLGKRKLARHIRTEDVLKAGYALQQAGQAHWTARDVADRTRLTPAQVRAAVTPMLAQGMIDRPGGGAEREPMRLTDGGEARARELVRAHRLWETYLADRANVPPQDVHLQAEELEHVHELADEVDEVLGHPPTDPHGEPIPR
jgi:ABC-type Mn2+/Zn2+ transport system permease subunit/Mn-dependent DtxR family transcriptional regulator